MQAKEVGVLITIETLMTLTGATCTLNVKGRRDLAPRALSFTPSGTTCTRTSTATDFPDAGVYFIQLIADFTGPTRQFRSQVTQIDVGGEL